MNDSEANIVDQVKGSMHPKVEEIDPHKPIEIAVSTEPTEPELHPAFAGDRPEEVKPGKFTKVAALILLWLFISLNAYSQASFIVTNDLSVSCSVGFFSWGSDGQNALSGVTTFAAGASGTVTSANNNNGIVVLTSQNQYALLVYFTQMAYTNGGKLSALFNTTGATLQATNNWQAPFNRPNSVTGGSVTNALPQSVPSAVVVYGGTNGPNGVYTAGIGSIFNLFDGTGTNFIQQYVKTTVNGANGWVANTNFASYAFTTAILTNAINTPSSVAAATISAPVITSPGFSGSFSGNAGSLTNATFPVWNVATIGDSLCVSNLYSGNLSFPLLLQTIFGFNVLTNGGFPGLTSGYISFPELDSIAPYFYTTTGQRTIGVLWEGKNDENTMAGDLVTLTNVANGIETNIMMGLYKIWSLGGDPVLVTIPHTAWPPAGPGTFTNSEPCTIYVNNWITNLPSQTNLLQGHKVVIADVAIQYPQTMYTNANGTLNTNVTGDGEHFSQYQMTNVASIIVKAITNSWIWKQPYPSVANNLGGYLTNNAAPIILPAGSGIQSQEPYGYGNVVTFKMGSYTQPAYFEDAYWDILSPTTQDIVGSAWVSGIDENSLATSGFRFMNKGRNWQFFVDTSDLAGIFVGATNLDKSQSFNSIPSLSLRGQEMLYPVPYLFFPNSCPVNQVVIHNETGVLRLGCNFNGTPGIAVFDGQTFLATNISAGVNGIISGNGAGITNQASINWINITMGQLYTNNTTHFWALNIPVVFTNAAAVGTNVIGLEVWRSGTLGYIVSKAGYITTAATTPGPAWDNLNGFVPPGGAFAVTNLATLQLTETNNIDYGIGITNMIQIY